MPRYAVSSFVPEAAYWCFHWVDRGPADRDTVLAGMPDPSLLKVHPLPCQHSAALHFQDHAKWVVLEIDPADYVEQEGLVDFRKGNVIFTGSPREACEFLRELGLPMPSSVPVVVAGDWQTAEAGEFGVAVAGSSAVARSGECGVAFVNFGGAEAGDKGVAVSPFGQVVAGDAGFAITIYGRSATAGDGGLARVDEFGTATAGNYGTAISEHGVSRVGDGGLALAYGTGTAVGGAEAVAFSWGGCDRGVAQAGPGGVLAALWHDGERYRLAVAHVGEGGIEPDTPYRVNEEGHFVRAVGPTFRT